MTYHAVHLMSFVCCFQSSALASVHCLMYVFGGAGHEMRLLRAELWRRFTSRVPLLSSSLEPKTHVVNVATAQGSRSPY
jgi:hypothetical protein